MEIESEPSKMSVTDNKQEGLDPAPLVDSKLAALFSSVGHELQVCGVMGLLICAAAGSASGSKGWGI